MGGGAPDLSEAVKDMQRMNMPAQIIAELQAHNEQSARRFEVWPVNMPIVDAFLAVVTQWRTEAMPDGRLLWLGLDYTAVRARVGQLTTGEWRRLATMERGAAAALNGEQR